MRIYILVLLALCMAGIYLFGCGKKQQPLEEMQAPMSIESMGAISTEEKTVPETKTTEVSTVATTPASGEMLKPESLPPSGPYKPTAGEIQTALRNAGFYAGKIDGKIGPMTKKAIEDFQKANGLQVDGKVGPKTWASLEKYLSSASSTAPVPVGTR